MHRAGRNKFHTYEIHLSESLVKTSLPFLSLGISEQYTMVLQRDQENTAHHLNWTPSSPNKSSGPFRLQYYFRSLGISDAFSSRLVDLYVAILKTFIPFKIWKS